MAESTSKADLIERIGRERALWDALVAEIGAERMEQPGVTGEWTFKDVVVHLIGWRKAFLAQVQAVVRGANQPAAPWPAHLNEEKEEDVEQINEWFYEQGRGRSLNDVLDEYRQLYQSFEDAARALSEQDLFEPGRFVWMEGEPLANGIAYSPHFHEEHEPIIRAWLASQRGHTPT
jgi:hypothetical protein